MSQQQFWIGVVSKDHVDRATAGGFAQVNHGKAGPLERMRAGDGFAFYSPRTSYPDGAPHCCPSFHSFAAKRIGVRHSVSAWYASRPPISP